jgi:hypothetical protein
MAPVPTSKTPHPQAQAEASIRSASTASGIKSIFIKNGEFIILPHEKLV